MAGSAATACAAWGIGGRAALAGLARGVTVEGVRYGPIEAALEARKGDNAWLTVALRRGPQPRGAPGHGASRPAGEPADPGGVRPVPARQAAARRGRRGAGQGAARATARKTPADAHHRRRLARPAPGRARRRGDPAHRRPGAPGAVRHAAARPLGRPGRARGRRACWTSSPAPARWGWRRCPAAPRHAVFLERDRAALAALRANIAACGAEARCRVLAADALRPPPGQPCALVFLDPPYGAGSRRPSAVAALARAGWIAPAALIVAEIGRDDRLPAVPSHWPSGATAPRACWPGGRRESIAGGGRLGHACGPQRDRDRQRVPIRLAPPTTRLPRSSPSRSPLRPPLPPMPPATRAGARPLSGRAGRHVQRLPLARATPPAPFIRSRWLTGAANRRRRRERRCRWADYAPALAGLPGHYTEAAVRQFPADRTPSGRRRRRPAHAAVPVQPAGRARRSPRI